MNYGADQKRSRALGWIATTLAVVVVLYAINSATGHEWFWFVLDCVGILFFSYVALWNLGVMKYAWKGIRRR